MNSSKGGHLSWARAFAPWRHGLVALLGLALGQSCSHAGEAEVATARSDVMPAPLQLRFLPGRLPITEAFQVATLGHDDARLQNGIERALGRLSARTGLRLLRPITREATTAAFTIEC